MRLIASILFVVFALLATACSRVHYLKPEKAFSENDDDAIVVMRTVPNAYVEIQHGHVNGDGWFTYGSTGDLRSQARESSLLALPSGGAMRLSFFSSFLENALPGFGAEA